MNGKTDFILMGMPKCGTTSFFQVMKQHSQIEMPFTGKHVVYYKKFKNVHEFDKKYWRGRAEKRKHGFCAENWNIYKINALEMAVDFKRDIKILFIVRNPVERAYSEYKYSHSMCYSNFNIKDIYRFYKNTHEKSFDRYVETYLHKNRKIFRNGKYFEIINPFIKSFGKDKVKVIIFEELIQNKEKAYQEIFDFLEIRKERCNFDIKTNEGKMIPEDAFEYCLYRTVFMCAIWPITVAIKNYVYSDKVTLVCDKVNEWFWSHWLSRDRDKSGISSQTYDTLKQYYIKDSEKLSRLLGKDLKKLWYE